MKSKLVIKLYDETGKKYQHAEYYSNQDTVEKCYDVVQSICERKGVQTDDEC